MTQIIELNKTLIGVETQLESMRNTYRKLHKHETPVGNPIVKEIEKILLVLPYLRLKLIQVFPQHNINLSKLENVSEIVTDKRCNESKMEKIYEV